MEPNKQGRPSGYTAKLAASICERLGLGESLRSICDDDGMPTKAMVMRWLAQKEDFRDQYAHARAAQADHWAEEIVEISDDSTNDYMEKERDNGSTYEALNSENINRSRLRVDTRKWLMARMAPKKYGDKVALVGDSTDDPIKHVVTMEYVKASK